MNDMSIGLIAGGAAGIAFACSWLLAGALIAGRRDDRAQTDWDLDVAQALNLSRSERGNTAVIGGVVVLALMLVLAGFWVTARLASQDTITCTVTDKDRTTKVTSDGNGGTTSSSDALIYTEDCGTLQVTDELLKGQFTSADTYASIEPGHRYEFDIIGWRVGWLSELPNVLTVTEVDQ